MKATVATDERAIVALIRNASWPRVHVASKRKRRRSRCDLLVHHVEHVVVCNVRREGSLANTRPDPR